jgi:dihydroorotase/allantoinase
LEDSYFSLASKPGSMSVDLRVENCTVVTEAGPLGPGVGVAVDDGTIVAVARETQLPAAEAVIDGAGDLLVPGIVDTHIHNRSPGLEYKEDWTSATRAAAAGGVTTVVGMPNTDPVVDSPAPLARKYELGEEGALVDFQSYAVLTSDNLDQIGPLANAGVLGYKVFLGTDADGIAPPTDGELHAAMSEIAETGRRIGFHTENREIVSHYSELARREGRTDPIEYARARPPIAEVEGTSRVLELAADTDCPIHVFQLSTGSAARRVDDAKAAGVDVTVETCPHFLWFSEEVMHEKGGVAAIQPPLRPEDERDGLWTEGIDGGVVDCIGTDHSPHTDEEKGLTDDRDIWEVATGFPGLETAVPAMLTFVADGRLSLAEWVRLHSTRPAQVWGMYPKKGSLAVGTDADFTLVDPDREWTLDRSQLRSKNTATPFDGESFRGSVSRTVVRGELVYDRGTVVGDPGHGTIVTV